MLIEDDYRGRRFPAAELTGRADRPTLGTFQQTQDIGAIWQRDFKVGIVGCGLIAQVMHLHYLRELPELYEIAALCDVSEDVRDACARDYGVATTFADWRELIAAAAGRRVHPDLRQPRADRHRGRRRPAGTC